MSFACESCNITIKNKCHLNRHLKSAKHNKITKPNKEIKKQIEINQGLQDYITFMDSITKVQK